MTPLRQIFALVTVCVVTTAGACGPGQPPTPQEGPTFLPVPFENQERPWYCVPAVIWMIKAFIDPWNVPTQDAIWNWMDANYDPHVIPSIPGGVTDTEVVAAALSHFLNQNVVTAQYPYEFRQRAVADQDLRMREGKPTSVAINDFTHLVLVKGSNWKRLADAIQRPDGMDISVHDPATGPGRAINIGVWMNVLIPSPRNGNAVLQWLPRGDQNRAQPALQVFDQAGGVYEGPPPNDPPGRYRLDGNGSCYWEWNDFGDNQCSSSPPGGSNVLQPGDRLYAGQYFDSLDGRFRFAYQTDGNLVLYGPSGALWATMTFDSPGVVEMQSDGNLVMYNSSGAPVWHSATHGAPGAYFVLQNDGNGVIFAGSTPIWETGTGGW